MVKKDLKKNLSSDEKKLLQAKTPFSYIDRSLQLNIPSGRKAVVARIWMDRTGYTVDDIKYARNRHPYWKARKMAGTAERNMLRFIDHDYSGGVHISWDDELTSEFIEYNRKDKNGKYQNKDWELAKHFKTTIASIQHMRRKYNMAVKLIEKQLGKVTDRRLLSYFEYSETELREMVKKL